jgi:hypothetical protein
MQYAHPPVDRTGLDPSKWVRKRHNHRLLKLVPKPLEDAREAGFDPWTWDGSTFHYESNPQWEAAVLEYNRRFQAYKELRFNG